MDKEKEEKPLEEPEKEKSSEGEKTLPGETKINKVDEKKEKNSEWKLHFDLKIRKKFLLYLILPLVLIGLLIFGLIQQGFMSDWINYFKRASITLTVTDQKSQPLDSVQVMVGDALSVTDKTGGATLDKLVSGKITLSLRRTGFVPLNAEVTLKRGANSLGTYQLAEVPAKKVTLTLSITDYISASVINDAHVSLGEIKPTSNAAGNILTFTLVPVGSYKLTVSKNGYNSYSADTKITEKMTELGKVELVKTGVVIFESNRDKGLRGIFTANYDGTNQKALLTRVGDYEDYSPALSPNQKKLFFFSTRDGVKVEGSSAYKEALYVANLDGTGIIKVHDDTESYNARWSPDSSLITFVTRYDTTNGNVLKVYNVGQKQIVSFDDYNWISSYSVAVSNDAKLVAFSGKVKAVPVGYGFFVANADSTNVRTIENMQIGGSEFTTTGKIRYSYYDSVSSKTKYFEYDPIAATKAEISAPAIDKVGGTLSPDNKLRAYISTRDGKSNLFISNADSTNEIQLTTLNKVSGNILWSLDSSFVTFDLSQPGESARYLIAAKAGAKAKKIVDINSGGWF